MDNGRLDIQQVTAGKKRYLSLLLLADEQESMIDRYLERGDLYVMSCQTNRHRHFLQSQSLRLKAAVYAN